MTPRPMFPKKLPGWVFGGVAGCIIITAWMWWVGAMPAQVRARELLKRMGGPEAVECLQQADVVFATRVERRRPGEGVSLADYSAMAEPVEVPQRLRVELQRLLVSPDNYELSSYRTCQPEFVFRLAFRRSGGRAAADKVDVWVCLKCDHIEFPSGTTSNGRILFTPMAHELGQLAVQLFPNDEAIAQAVR